MENGDQGKPPTEFLGIRFQQCLRPTVVSMYTYLQPIVAVAVSIFSGMDVLDYKKVAAILLVFTGVWLVNRSKSKHPEDGRNL